MDFPSILSFRWVGGLFGRYCILFFIRNIHLKVLKVQPSLLDVYKRERSRRKKMLESHGIKPIKIYRHCPKEKLLRKKVLSSSSICLRSSKIISFISFQKHQMSQVGIIFHAATICGLLPNPL